MVYAQQKPPVDVRYQKFFEYYVDKRSIMEKSLNLIGLTTSDVGRSFAIIAGVSEYSYLPSQYKKLKPAEEDIRKLLYYLKNYEFFDEIVLLKNKDMNLDNLSFFLQSYFPDRLKKFLKSRFLFAYSGHGFTDGEDSYLMEYTAQNFNDKVNSINVMSLKVLVDEVVKSAEASDDYVLVLLNACYAGTFLKRPFGGKDLLPKHGGSHAITAGGTQEQTWHDPKIGTGSVFFEKFFAGLDGHADLYPKDSNGDGLITVDELATYITEEVKISTDQNQNPQSGDISKNGSLGGFFFLNRRRQVDKGLMSEWNPKTGKAFGEDSLPNEIIGKDGAPMVLIPVGEFEMGSNDGKDDEKPVHTVYLDAFYIDKYEVINEQYKKFMDATGHKAPGFWNDSKLNDPKQPVMAVDWDDANAYAEWAGKRLPTEAEWEKSARGGLVGKKYPLGDTLTHDDANYFGTGGKARWEYTAPVGSFAPNGYGLYDMAGNVSEWCADWYDESYYTNSPKQNPTGPSSGKWRVLRGGSWYDSDDAILCVAYRSYDYYFPTNVYLHVGFRCVQ